MEKEEKEKIQHYAFFQNKECEFFPCHKGIPEEEFNCLFCYCPLYALGRKCGGNFTYTDSGIKSCMSCGFPHWKKNYDKIIKRFPEIATLASGNIENHSIREKFTGEDTNEKDN